MQKLSKRRLAALAIGLSLVATACGGSENGSGSDTTVPADAGELTGMKGTLPLVALSDEFKNRLKEIDSELKDYSYAAETYDSVVVIALSAEVAKTDGIKFASEINGVTRGGEKCTTFVACLDLVKAGTDIDYDGVSGPLEFSGNGEPTQASYGVQVFGSDNRIDDAKTTFVEAEAPASADVAQVPVVGTRAGDGELKIGSILPQTGSLAFLGPPEFAGFDLAIKDINAAGGVLGKNVVGIKGDSGDSTTDTASKTVDAQLSQGVDAIIGAASSGVSLTVIDKIVAAGVVQFSPANTSKELSGYADKGLYFRSAPSDILQGAVLANVISGDGASKVAIIARNDSYGTGLAEDLAKGLEAAGVEVVIEKIYDEKATAFDAEVDAIKGASPDAIVIIGFDETSKILATMVEKGVGPKNVKVYGCDGNMGNALGENFTAGK